MQQFLVVNPPPPKKEEKLVRITVHFVELDKDYNKIFGFKWQPGFTADPTITVGQGGQGGAGATGASLQRDDLEPASAPLERCRIAGYARVLKTGTRHRQERPAGQAQGADGDPVRRRGPDSRQRRPPRAPRSASTIAITPKILGQSEDIEMDLKINQTNLVGRTRGQRRADDLAPQGGRPRSTSSRARAPRWRA